MKLTLAEVRWMQKGLSAITQMPLPIKVSYKLSKLFQFCNKEMAAVEQARVDLVKRLAEPNPETPGELKVTAENEEVFRKEFEELLLEEVEIDFTPIKLSELSSELKLSPVEMASLSKVIEE